MSSENKWFSLRSFLRSTDSALNIIDFFWSSPEHCWRRDFTCSPKNNVKISQSTPVTFFFHLPGLVHYFSPFFVLVRSFLTMESKGNTDFWKITFNIGKKNDFLGVFMVFVSLLLASNVQSWLRDVQKCSLLNQLLPETSNLSRLVSSEHRWKRKNLGISSKNDWISMRAQSG